MGSVLNIITEAFVNINTVRIEIYTVLHCQSSCSFDCYAYTNNCMQRSYLCEFGINDSPSILPTDYLNDIQHNQSPLVLTGSCCWMQSAYILCVSILHRYYQVS